MKLPYLYQANENGEFFKQVNETTFMSVDPRPNFPEIRISPTVLLDYILKQQLRPVTKEAFDLAFLEANQTLDKIRREKTDGQEN